MPLIDQTVLLGIADRAASQYKLIADALASADVEGGGWYFDRVTDTEDPDVEIPTINSYEAMDEDLLPAFNVKNGTLMSNIVSGMNAHFARPGPTGLPLQAGGWDGYLENKDVRVSWYFNLMYFAVCGRYMLAVNVFSEGDDDFGDVEIIAGPSVQFTDGVNYGNGAVTNPADGNYYAATQLKIVVVNMGGNDVDLKLYVKDIDNLPTTITVNVPASQPPGTEIAVGATSDRYLDLTNVSFIPFGSYGTLGDSFSVRNIKERNISL